MKITALQESADFATLDTEKLFTKLKSHELSCKGRLNHETSLTSRVLITSTQVGRHDANPTNITISSALKFALSSLVAASDEQHESIPNDKITLLTRMFQLLHPFCKERRRLPRGCLSAVTPPTSSPTAPRGRSSTPSSTSTTTPSGMTTTRVMIRISTASGIRRRRNFRRSCLERVLPSVTSTSLVTTPLA
jgi:hypothetical protein